MTLHEQRPIGSGFCATTASAEVLAGFDLAGRVALVTGGSSGLGLATVMALAGAGARVVVPVRRASAAQAAFASTRAVTVVDGFDLGDLGSVARTAAEITDVAEGFDIVVAAAGVMATSRRLAGPGWDYQLAVNHVGHFALIARLYPLLAARRARVVVYSSAGHHASDIQWDDPHFLGNSRLGNGSSLGGGRLGDDNRPGGYDKWAAYGQSKTANILFAAQLDRLGRRDGVRAFSLHPGKILTGLQRDVSTDEQVALGWIDHEGNIVAQDMKTPSQGAATGLWAATSPLLDGRGGLYLEDCDIASVAESGGSMDDGGVQPYALDPDAAARLWQLTARATATDLPR